MEKLTLSIAKEYRKRALVIVSNERQEIGDRRKLRIELQKKCDLTEVQATNIINGFHISDYIALEKIKAKSK